MAAHPQQPAPYNGYLSNGAPRQTPAPGATPLLPNQGRVVQSGSTRILCLADVRGNLRSINELARSASADYVIHTGDFGFYDQHSLNRIAEKTLKHVAQYSPLISEDIRRTVTNSPPNTSIKDRVPRDQLPLSQLPYFLNNSLTFEVPVYAVWGACEDVQVLEKLRSGEYKINNLHIIDESHSRLLDVGGVKLRLFGLGGAIVMHKLFDNGEGRTTIAGGQGTMWTTLLQMGELVDTASRLYDPSETRVLVTHASPAREGLLNQLSVALKVDFSISAGLHFRYGSSYNEFSVNPTLDHYRGKLAASKASFNDVWETVKGEVEPAVSGNDGQQRLLGNALELVNKMPGVANGGNPFGGQVGPNAGQIDESAFKNMWNFNLADAAFGWLVLDVDAGRIATEMKAQGFNFAHRGQKMPPISQADVAKSTTPSAPSAVPTGPATNQAQGQPQGGPMRGPGAAAPSAPLHNRPNQQAPPPRMAQAAPPQTTQSSQQAPNAKPSAPTTNLPAAPPTAPNVNQNEKPPASTAPTATNNNSGSSATNEKSITGDAKTNGAVDDTGASKATPPPSTEKKPSQGIFVSNVGTEEEVKNLFSEKDRASIQRMEKLGKNWIAHFSSHEEMMEVLNETNKDLRNRPAPSNGQKPTMRPYEDRRSNFGGSWNSRGGGAQQGGYRSGGASDSETGRRGRGGGWRGRGRGSQRGRGGFGGNRNQGEGASGNSIKNNQFDGASGAAPDVSLSTPGAPTEPTGGW
ncbi:MAG: hypothetical protein M1831_003679 [Alyxoria varia]|nr:MAG: hypothetical protein M1831_003679 [Alyxoria varia]